MTITRVENKPEKQSSGESGWYLLDTQPLRSAHIMMQCLWRAGERGADQIRTTQFLGQSGELPVGNDRATIP
jgi:hypothetical protein